MSILLFLIPLRGREKACIIRIMTFYIESHDTDPSRNLALEQFVFDKLDRGSNYCMLWQNYNSVIVGKNQNTSAEINIPFVNARNISVVRRLSGGGAVYHDLGNVNFTFITGIDKENDQVDLTYYCKPVQKALFSFGVPAMISGRNDMEVEEKKISGNAQYIKNGRVMHHGTLLYDSDLDTLSNALNITDDKIESKGIKSVKSRVVNIRPYMKNDMPVKEFFAALKNFLFNSIDMEEYSLTAAEETEVDKIKENVYSQWTWNYGASPPYNIRKVRRIENCGRIEILLEVGKEGVINNICFFGDFFGTDDTGQLAAMLKDHRLEYNELSALLKGVDITRFFHNTNTETFLSLLLE
jgi:lipoate-protein ligase A